MYASVRSTTEQTLTEGGSRASRSNDNTNFYLEDDDSNDQKEGRRENLTLVNDPSAAANTNTGHAVNELSVNEKAHTISSFFLPYVSKYKNDKK